MRYFFSVPILASILILGAFTVGFSFDDVFAGKDDNNGNKGCENANPNSKACEKNPNTELDEATIDPTSGPIGTPFTITDPQGRIQVGDNAFFYVEGADPGIAGHVVTDVTISSDGTTLTGTVPTNIVPSNQDKQFFVHVAPTAEDDSRFPGLAFFVTSLPPATVIIHLQDLNNNPIPDAFCRASDPSGGFIFQIGGFTDENGQVTLSWANPFITSVILDCFQDNVSFVLIGLTCITDAPRAVLITEGDDFCIFDPV